MAITHVTAAASGSIFDQSFSFNPLTNDLVIGAACNGSDTPTNMGATLGGVTMTAASNGVHDGFMSVRAFWLTGVSTGSKTFAPSDGTFRGMACISITGAHQTVPVRVGSASSANNNEGNDDQSVISVACQVGDLVVGVLGAQNVTAINWTGLTFRAQVIESNAGLSIASGIAASTSVSITVDYTPGFSRGAVMGFAITPAATAAPFLTTRFKLRGT